MSLTSQSPDVAITQTTYTTDAGSESRALRELLESVAVAGLLIQADALPANNPFSPPTPRATPTA